MHYKKTNTTVNVYIELLFKVVATLNIRARHSYKGFFILQLSSCFQIVRGNEL